MLSEQDRAVLVLWSSVDGVGSQTLCALVHWSQANHISLAELWHKPSLLPQLAKRRRLIRGHSIVSKQFTAASYQEWLHERRIQYVLSEDAAYPFLLSHSRRHPYILYYRGQAEVLQHELPIAVVGTRHITEYGIQATRQLAGDLVRLGAQIVSGFMYGVDVTAHEAALALGGSTVAVLGFGLTTMYPKSQTRLAEKLVAAGGILVSPFAPTVEARPGNFPARNAIVAGLSKAVVVTEAAVKSGSLITAKSALEEGRAVCAVSGPYDSMYAVGTKWLLNQGATMVTCARDILTEIGVVQSAGSDEDHSDTVDRVLEQFADQPELQRLYTVISQTQPTLDELATALSIDVAALTNLLTTLELAGAIERTGLRYMVCYPPCN